MQKSSQIGRSGVSLYLQVSQLLLRRLETGEWTLGDRIPTIDELMAQYGVSRVTMRQALSQLEKEGLVQRGRGRGTFVTGDATHDRWLILPTEWADLVSHIDNLNARVEVLSSSRGDMPVATVPGGRAGSYWRTRRVNFSETAPYSLTEIYLAWDAYSQCAAQFAKRAILPLLARRGRPALARASQTLEISTADVETARYLQLDVGAPIAEVQRCAWDINDRLVYLANIRYPGRHVRIDTNLRVPAMRTQRGQSTQEMGLLQ